MKRRASALGRVAALILAIVAPSFARADEPVEDAGAARTAARNEDPRGYWSAAPAQPFIGAIVDVGTMVRARGLLGYGKPHWTWGGIELEGSVSSEAAFTAVRARLALVVADIGLAYRRTWSFRRTWLMPSAHYRESDLKGSPRADYQSLDLDVWGLIPAGSGYVQWELEAVRLYGLPSGSDVYEEWLRTPMAPPWATASRLAYGYLFCDQRAAVGAMGEWVWLGAHGHLVRLGPLVSYAFTPHWEATFVVTTPVHGPDDLAFFTGLYGIVRVRWKFASGESRSVFR